MCPAGLVRRGDRVCQADTESRKFGGAIPRRVFRPCVRVDRIRSDNLSQWRMSFRVSSYTRRQRQGTSEDEFPGRSIRGRDAAPGQRAAHLAYATHYRLNGTLAMTPFPSSIVTI